MGEWQDGSVGEVLASQNYKPDNLSFIAGTGMKAERGAKKMA